MCEQGYCFKPNSIFKTQYRLNICKTALYLFKLEIETIRNRVAQSYQNKDG
jgi:hypothetical protein